MKKHRYKAAIQWTGNIGEGTKSYNSYERSYNITIKGKTDVIKGSSDPAFLGDPSKHNPEDLFLSSIASCHMLWYLHLCATHHIIVKSYSDTASAEMEEESDGAGRFTSVTLQPQVTIVSENHIEKAIDLHTKANSMCFIANSLNFKVLHQPEIIID